MLKYRPNLKNFSQQLRKNLTDAEKLIWFKIRRKQLDSKQFYRQKPIGNYIADFYCPKGKLIIEIDGGQHYEDESILKDKIREEELKKLGLRILRFTNLDILKNIDGVILKIEKELNPP